MLIPSDDPVFGDSESSLSRRVNANSQPDETACAITGKLIKKGEC